MSTLAMWAFGLLLLAVIGAIVVVAAGHGEPLAPADVDRPDTPIPTDRDLRGDDLRTIRFTTAVRGYRASEVDDLLRRLARQLDSVEGRGT